jgi:lipopolysaccharide biosynthesis glycosyltransferase
MATDRRFEWGCAVAGRSLLDAASDPGAIHLHVLHPDLSAAEEQRLAESWGGTRSAGSVTFHKFALDRVRHLVRSKHVSHMAYARLFLTDFVPSGARRAVYIDTDLLFNRDVLALAAWPLDGAIIGAVPNGSAADSAGHFARLGVAGSVYFNSGVLVCDVAAWGRERVAERALNFAASFEGELALWDQDLLNAVLIGQWQELPGDWNCWARRAERANDIVLHFTMSPKPWDADYSGQYRDEFFAVLDRTAYAGCRPPYWLGLAPRLLRLRRRVPYLPTALRYGKKAARRWLGAGRGDSAGQTG